MNKEKDVELTEKMRNYIYNKNNTLNQKYEKMIQEDERYTYKDRICFGERFPESYIRRLCNDPNKVDQSSYIKGNQLAIDSLCKVCKTSNTLFEEDNWWHKNGFLI